MKCVLFSTITLLPLITLGIFYFCHIGGFNRKSQKENVFECSKEVLSCINIASQLLNEVPFIQFDNKSFQNIQDEYLQLGKLISKIECEDDLSFCRTTTIETIADALGIKFSFNCTTNLKEGDQGQHHCDEWDYFDIYVHCDAHILPLEHLLEQDECKLKKDQKVQCDTNCTWGHEVKRSSRVVKRQAIAADSPTIQTTTSTTTTTTMTPSTTGASTFPPTMSMASISKAPTTIVTVQTMIPSTTEVTTGVVTTPTMASNMVIPTAPGTGITSKPKRRNPAHCLRKHVGPPTGPITTSSTPSTMTGTGSKTTLTTMTGSGSTTTPSTMTGSGSTTTPSTMTGPGSTTTPSTMTGIGSTPAPSTVTGNGSTTTPSTMTGVGSTAPSIMTGNGSTTTPSTMTGTGSTTTPSTMTGAGSTTPSFMTGNGSTTTPSFMTGTGSTTTPSNMTGTTSTTVPTPTTVTTTTTAPPPPSPRPPPPPPRPQPPPPRPPPPACSDACTRFGFWPSCKSEVCVFCYRVNRGSFLFPNWKWIKSPYECKGQNIRN